jgi:DNA-binding beta-propeller fold protein YncE
VKPTERIAKSAVTPKTGHFATLSASLRAKGGGAPGRSLVATSLIALCVVVSVLALAATVARAEPPKLIPYGSFETEDPFGVAVNQSNADVYVAAVTGANVNEFNATGERISPPAPFGSGSGLYSGVAVNPTNGDVYVVDAADQAIDTYDPGTGALLSSFEVSGCANGLLGSFTWSQIAADSAGDVYLACAPQNSVRRYSPSGTLLQTFRGSGPSALKEPTGVAVGASGNVWVADDGNNRIERFSASGTVVGTFESNGVQALAVDAREDVYALVLNSEDLCGSFEPPCTHVIEYSASGARLADVGAGEIENGFQNGFYGATNTLAVNDSSGRLYVADTERGVVWIYGPPTAPVIGKEVAAEVSTSEAKLGALVNPGGIAASYRFEYGTTAAYGQVAPFPEGSVGEGLAGHSVWAAASDLVPGTTYHYRVVATNELGTVYGPDQTFTTLTAEQALCPNEQLRGDFAARLPDCRAYELVTPPTKNSVEVANDSKHGNSEPGFVVAGDGDSIAYPATLPLPGAPSGGYRSLATREAGGWGSEGILPIESYSSIFCDGAGSAPAYSQELSKEIIRFGAESRFSMGEGEGECNDEGRQLVRGEPIGYENLVLRDNATGAYELINTPPPGITPADAHFKGASVDLSHVVFSEEAPLAEGARYGVENLYEWDEGTLRLLTVLPDGAAVTGSLPTEPRPGGNSISTDGSHIVFTAGGNLYARIDGQRTVQLDESQGPGASGGGSFQAASADGQEILFTDDSRLTTDSTAQAGEPDLYECVLPEGASGCRLTDLSVAGAGEHADVVTVSALGSQDTSHVYFTARGVLASNTLEYTDSEGKAVVERAESGQLNLYVWNDGTTAFIAQLSSNNKAYGKASPDGASFAFVSERSLTGYDNIQPDRGRYAATELYLYSDSANQLACASCNPTGEAPIIGGGVQESQNYVVVNGGHLFFETPEALVPSDTNDQVDVYEYEGGHLYLISSGTSSSESSLVGASESGDDIFFRTRQQLVAQDTQEGAQVIYDASADGGFPEAVILPPCTTADSCRAPVSPQPSIYGAPSSQTFSGAGNLAPPSEAKSKVKSKAKPAKCKRGFVKQKGRCVKRSGKKSRRKSKQSAHSNRKAK